MRYELLLQSREVGAPFDPAPIDALLTARGAKDQPDGSRLWRLKHGDVEVRRLLENGVPIAFELKIDLSDKTDLVRELLLEAVQLATDADARAVDPNLAKTLTANDEGLVADSFFRTAKYAGEYAGVSSAVMASYGSAEPEGMKKGTRLLLIGAGVVVFLYLLIQQVT